MLTQVLLSLILIFLRFKVLDMGKADALFNSSTKDRFLLSIGVLDRTKFLDGTSSLNPHGLLCLWKTLRIALRQKMSFITSNPQPLVLMSASKSISEDGISNFLSKIDPSELTFSTRKFLLSHLSHTIPFVL